MSIKGQAVLLIASGKWRWIKFAPHVPWNLVDALCFAVERVGDDVYALCNVRALMKAVAECYDGDLFVEVLPPHKSP